MTEEINIAHYQHNHDEKKNFGNDIRDGNKKSINS